MNFSDFKNSENLLSEEQMKALKGGTTVAQYCGTMLMIKRHNELSSSALSGWISGWTSYCQHYTPEQLELWYNNVMP